MKPRNKDNFLIEVTPEVMRELSDLYMHVDESPVVELHYSPYWKDLLRRINKMSKTFKLPLKTFSPENLLEEMVNAKDGDVFVLDERCIGYQLGDNRVEITIAQIKKVRDEEPDTAGTL